MTDYLISALATLLVVSDPLLMSALFVAVTHGMNEREKNEVALRGTVIAFCIMVAAGLVGAKLLELLGITLSAFRIAGGLLLLSSSAEMVFDRRSKRLKNTAETAITVDHVRNIAAFPLAIPLIAGPGAITTMILLAGRSGGRIDYLAGLIGVTALVMLACYIAFRLSNQISRTLGITGRAVITRLLGILLAALAVQFIIDGVTILVK